MDSSLIIAIALFAFVMSVTPGPNNIMLLASGAQFGYQRTLPHIAGIIIGVALLLLLVLSGLGAIFARYPEINQVLKLLGSVYLCYLAWKIATASPSLSLNDEAPRHAPMRLMSAISFQFVNPKAWAMSIGSISSFTLAGEQYLYSGVCIMLCFATTGFVAISLWAYSGEKIASLLTTAARQRLFNRVMGLFTMASLVFIVN